MNPSRWLALAASPTFAVMAFGSLVQGSPPMGSGGFEMEMPQFGGMTVMYVLMALFHAQPWLHLMGRRVSGAGPQSANARRSADVL